MKSDLDRLMSERNLDGLWVTGPGMHNPAMSYFTGLAPLTRADLVKARGQEPVLYYYPMERDNAIATGLRTKNINDYDPLRLLREARGNRARAMAARLKLSFEELGLHGRVGVYGTVDASLPLAVAKEVHAHMPEVTLVGEGEDTLLIAARATKDEAEIERIRQVGRATTAVVARTAEYLITRRVRGDTLLREDGQVLTVRDVKAHIAAWCMEQGLEDSEGVIFAIGRDGGVPHSTGKPNDPIRLGQPIVFDFFPQEIGGGYFYDITRTWCLGHAPKEVEQLHTQVQAAYNVAFDSFTPGMLCRYAQRRVCEYFEAQGHPTLLSNTTTEVGYVHTLGHGVGLNIHESPNFADVEQNNERLEPGMVFTLEPGLYYPERGMGVRLEDTLLIGRDARIEVLAEYPMDLVLPMRKASRASASRAKSAPRRPAQPAARTTKRAARKSTRPTGRAKPRRR